MEPLKLIQLFIESGIFSFLSCCSGDSPTLDNELNLSNCKPEDSRSRSSSSIHMTVYDDRKSTNTSNYKNTGMLETIYEDEFSLDVTY